MLLTWTHALAGHRRLRPTQRQYLMDTFRKFPSALYLKLSLKRARTWRSFTPDDKVSAPVRPLLTTALRHARNRCTKGRSCVPSRSSSPTGSGP